MRKLIAILAVTLAIPTMSFAEGEGRYQIVSTGDLMVFVLDTKTGLLKFCHVDDGTFNPPMCSPAKDTSK